uniref:DUF3750 domain-containing protein n=1 Tax=uncultured Alphaproteobacteria bacterium TaxID=91750 RepID=A0A6M4NN39_9PROT|nr:hypothetical protein PlAlph_1830 [uncultured Alphaproteobacteria bacterium]
MKIIEKKDTMWVIIIIFAALFFYDALFNWVDWRTANRESAGIAPLPQEENEAVVQVYTARVYNWRGYFAVHPWISVKKKGDDHYTVYQVTAWNLYSDGTTVFAKEDLPDRYWYGRKPHLLQSLIGEKAEKAIPKIEEAVKNYPYGKTYELWPGPNSNSFVAHIIRNVPELTVELPPIAIGKDFIGHNSFIAPTASGTGYQFSLLGLLSFSAGLKDGIEIGILGLNFGIDWYPPALKLPIIGRIGFKKF